MSERSTRIYHPHPGGVDDATWYANLPDPNGPGRVSLRMVQEYADAHAAWLKDALSITPQAKQTPRDKPVVNKRIEKYIAALHNAYLLTAGGTRPLPESQAYRAISALHREAFGLWPDAMRKEMPFGEVIRRLRQCVRPGDDESPTQLEVASHLPGFGLLVGLDEEGDPFLIGQKPVYPGLSYNDSCRLTTQSGFSFLPRALPSRPGTKDKMSYEERMAEAALGNRVSPIKDRNAYRSGEPERHPVYLDSTGVKDAHATCALSSKLRDKDTPNPDSFTVQTYTLRDLDLLGK